MRFVRNSPTSELKADPAEMPPFVPLCAACQYDLRGIPDGVCPECGTPFERQITELEMQRRWLADLARRKVSPDALLIVLAVCVVLALSHVLSITPTRPSPVELWSVAIWAGTLYWAWSGRWAIFRPSLLRLCWFVVPIVLGTIPFISGRPTEWTDLALSGVGTGAVILVWALTRPWQLWVPLALVATLLLSPSMAFGVVGGGRMLRGLTWSYFADLRSGQIYQQYPMRNDEVLLLGLSGIAPGLLLAAVAVVVALSERTVRRLR